PDLVQSSCCGLNVRVVDRNEARIAGVDEADVDVNTGWGNGFDVALVLRKRFGGSHARNQTHRYFGDRLGRDDSLGSRARKTPGHAVDVECGPRPGALEDTVGAFAHQLL